MWGDLSKYVETFLSAFLVTLKSSRDGPPDYSSAYNQFVSAYSSSGSESPTTIAPQFGSGSASGYYGSSSNTQEVYPMVNNLGSNVDALSGYGRSIPSIGSVSVAEMKNESQSDLQTSTESIPLTDPSIPTSSSPIDVTLPTTATPSPTETTTPRVDFSELLRIWQSFLAYQATQNSTLSTTATSVPTITDLSVDSTTISQTVENSTAATETNDVEVVTFNLTIGFPSIVASTTDSGLSSLVAGSGYSYGYSSPTGQKSGSLSGQDTTCGIPNFLAGFPTQLSRMMGGWHEYMHRTPGIMENYNSFVINTPLGYTTIPDTGTWGLATSMTLSMYLEGRNHSLTCSGIFEQANFTTDGRKFAFAFHPGHPPTNLLYTTLFTDFQTMEIVYGCSRPEMSSGRCSEPFFWVYTRDHPRTLNSTIQTYIRKTVDSVLRPYCYGVNDLQLSRWIPRPQCNPKVPPQFRQFVASILPGLPVSFRPFNQSATISALS